MIKDSNPETLHFVDESTLFQFKLKYNFLNDVSQLNDLKTILTP